MVKEKLQIAAAYGISVLFLLGVIAIPVAQLLIEPGHVSVAPLWVMTGIAVTALLFTSSRVAATWRVSLALSLAIVLAAVTTLRVLPVREGHERPMIHAAGKPSGELIDGITNDRVRIQDMRGNWTLVIFTVWSAQDLLEGMDGRFTSYSAGAAEQKSDLDRMLNYIHKQQDLQNVKVWVVRLDAEGAARLRPNGHFDRYLLASQKQEPYNPNVYGTTFRPTYNWMLNEWVKRYFPEKYWRWGPTASALGMVPLFAVLDPSGELVMMGRPGEAWMLHNDLLRAMHQEGLSTEPMDPRSPVSKSANERNGLASMMPFSEWNQRR